MNELLKATAVVLVGVMVGIVGLNITPYEEPMDSNFNFIMVGGPVGAAGGVTQMYVVAHEASPYTAFASNVTTNMSYVSVINTTGTGNVPYNTPFDIVVRVQFTYTHAYNVSNTSWAKAWVNASFECAELSLSGWIEACEAVIGNSGDSSDDVLWVNFWLQDADGGAGSGFQISHGQTITVKFQSHAYF